MTELDERALTLVRLGLGGETDIEEWLAKELEVDEADAARAIAAARTTHRAEAAAWAGETDCERLERAFDRLNEEGVLALHLAGYTQDDGYADVMEAYEEDPQGVEGYCFYHQQDAERALEDRGLYLAFGPIDPALETSQGPAIGRRIVAALAAVGFETQWDGSFDTRIHVTPFVWRLRPA